MKCKKNDKTLLFVSIGSFFVMSMSFLLNLFVGSKTSPKTIAVISAVSGGLFWGFLLTAVICMVLLSVRNKAETKKLDGLIGLISFFKNPIAKVADILLAVVAFFTAITVFIGIKDNQDIVVNVSLVLFSLLIFLFSMHCVLNGKIFRSVMGNAFESVKTPDKVVAVKAEIKNVEDVLPQNSFDAKPYKTEVKKSSKGGKSKKGRKKKK